MGWGMLRPHLSHARQMRNQQHAKELAMTEPPAQQPDERAERRVICPFCGSKETEPQAMFGSLMLTEQHYCRRCRTVFERVRDDEPALPDDS